MLVLSRKREEKIQIGANITITILRIKGRMVKIGVEAPEGIRVLRSELLGTASARKSPGNRATPAPPASAVSPGGQAPGDPAGGPTSAEQASASPRDGPAGNVRPRRRAPRADLAPQVPLTLHVGPALASAAARRLRCATLAQ